MAFAIDFGNANSTVTTVIRSGVDVILNEVRTPPRPRRRESSRARPPRVARRRLPRASGARGTRAPPADRPGDPRASRGVLPTLSHTCRAHPPPPPPSRRASRTGEQAPEPDDRVVQWHRALHRRAGGHAGAWGRTSSGRVLAATPPDPARHTRLVRESAHASLHTHPAPPRTPPTPRRSAPTWTTPSRRSSACWGASSASRACSRR